MTAEYQRPSAHAIYEQVVADGRSELNRSPIALLFSGIAAGLFMGLTGLGVAGAQAVLPGDASEFISLLFYPLGFIAVVIGRAQLFTENTLFPVVLVLENRHRLFVMLRLWLVVFVANVLGSLAFAGLVTRTGALPDNVLVKLVQLGTDATSLPLLNVFTSAIVGGWLVALMSWLVSSASATIGQVTVIWLMTFPVGLLHVAHCIASSGYILTAVIAGDVSAGTYLAWLGMATAGNIVGGVVIVALLNYWQVNLGGKNRRRRRLRLAENENQFRQVNDEISRESRTEGSDGTRFFVCECSDADCTTSIAMSDDEYRHIREHPRHFAVLNGHQTPEIEPIAERYDNYLVVEKTGEAGAVASRGASDDSATSEQPNR